MELYIDESGGMTTTHIQAFPYFVVCLIKPINVKLLRKRFKHFISNNLTILKEIDEDNKMFINDKFHELKGSALTKEIKLKFNDYIARDNLFEIYYIEIRNKNIQDGFYKNQARAFNYVLGLDIIHNYHNGNFTDKQIKLSIDERNVKTESKNVLNEYIAIKLSYDEDLCEEIQTHYYDSSKETLIQLSDFYSNLFYSYLRQKDAYADVIQKLKDNNYIKDIFYFPPKNK